MSYPKTATGFRFGRHRLKVLKTFGEVSHNGRTYRLVQVETRLRQKYLSLRLYNGQGRFIKQLLFEPELCPSLACIIQSAAASEPRTPTGLEPTVEGEIFHGVV